MGTWNSTPFGNDTALDWWAKLECADDAYELLVRTLGSVNPEWEGGAPEAEEAVAAAAVISAAAIDPIGRTNKDVKSWIATTGFVPDARLLGLAVSALGRVLDNSELRDLWEESGSLKSWRASTQMLLANVRTAETEGLPVRQPRRRGQPRTLYKLLEAYAKRPDEGTRAKIRQMVGRLHDPNETSSSTNYTTPLCLLAKYGLVDEARLLIEQGARVNAGSPSPFVAACVGGHIEMAELLRESGAQVFSHVERREGSDPFNAFAATSDHQMQVRGIEPKPPGYRYCLALFSVARSGSPRAADYLIGLGADIWQTDLNDENLLHKASESGNIAMLAFLLDAGLGINKTKGKFAESPLHYAVRAGKVDAVRFLLERGANPNVIDKFEGTEHSWYETPMDIANNGLIEETLREFGGKTAAEAMGR